MLRALAHNVRDQLGMLFGNKKWRSGYASGGVVPECGATRKSYWHFHMSQLAWLSLELSSHEVEFAAV